MIRRYVFALSVTVVLVIVDLITKRYAALSFQGEEVTVISGALSFTFIENPGSAFSIFEGGGEFFAVAALVAVGVVLVALRKPRPDLEVAAFGLILGGALGNFVDRIARGPGLADGTVIDWIRFPNFPVFNLADAGLTIGVALLFVAIWQESRQEAAA